MEVVVPHVPLLQIEIQVIYVFAVMDFIIAGLLYAVLAILIVQHAMMERAVKLVLHHLIEIIQIYANVIVDSIIMEL